MSTSEQLEQVLAKVSKAKRLAVDVEGNGLHAYKPRLCTVQLAWEAREGAPAEVAIIDTLVLPAASLNELLGADGPTKVLHDLTFDAQLLSQNGARLSNVRDTSVCARFLSIQALGLASLLSSELGIHVEKGYQRHDWAQRPFERAQLDYLANDVAHLLSLERKLRARAVELGIEGEVDDETEYKLSQALADTIERSPYLKIKGPASLSPVEQAVVRRLALLRETVACELDKPAFHIASVEQIQALALARPTSIASLFEVRGLNGSRVLDDPPRWIEAISQGVSDGKLSDEEFEAITVVPMGRAEIDRRRGLEDRLRRWRRFEAKNRGVDEQVVLPGHCLSALVAHPPASVDQLRATAGIGKHRLARYEETLFKMIASSSAT
ncbi:MAG: ribonuclease D [Polyangiaceae bacterium]